MSDLGPAEFAACAFASAGVTAVFAAPVGVLGLLSCFKGRRLKDSARNAFVALRMAFIFIFLGFVLHAAQGALNGVNYTRGYSFRAVVGARRTSLGIGTASYLFSCLGDVALVLTLAELGNGFMFALTRQRTSSQKIFRVFGAVSAVIMLVMSLASIGLSVQTYTQFYDAEEEMSSTDAYIEFQAKMRRVDLVMLTYTIINWAVSLVLLVQASVVRHQFRNVQPSKNSVTLYLVAAVLYFFPLCTWSSVQYLVGMFSAPRILLPDIDTPTTIIFGIIAVFIVLVLLFTVAIRRQNGLWTTLQPWMNGTAPTMTKTPPLVYGAEYYGAGQPLAYQQYAQHGQNGIVYYNGVPYIWQGGQQQQQHHVQPIQQTEVQEIPGISPHVVPAGDPVPMMGPEPRMPGQVAHEMKA